MYCVLLFIFVSWLFFCCDVLLSPKFCDCGRISHLVFSKKKICFAFCTVHNVAKCSLIFISVLCKYKVEDRQFSFVAKGFAISRLDFSLECLVVYSFVLVYDVSKTENGVESSIEFFKPISDFFIEFKSE